MQNCTIVSYANCKYTEVHMIVRRQAYSSLTHPVSHLFILRCGGILALISQGEGLADVSEDIALKKEGVILWLELDAVALEGCLLGG